MINRKKYYLLGRIFIVLLILLYGNIVHAKPHKLVQKVIQLLEKGAYQKKKKKVSKKKKEDKKTEIVAESTKKDEEKIDTQEGDAIAEEEIPYLQQAKTLIDQAIDDAVANKQASTWYYRGLIYEKLIRENIASNEVEQLLTKTLQSYHKAQALVVSTDSLYYSASQMNLDNLWNYFLDRGRRYYRQGVFEYAMSQLKICERIKPKDPLTTLYMGIVAHHNDDFTQALQKYETYLSFDNNTPAVYAGIAAIYQHLQEDDKALVILTKGIQKHPFDNNLLDEQLKIYTKLNHQAAQEQILTERIRNNPLNAALHYALGYWYENTNQLALAISYYKKAVNLVPAELSPIRQLGLLYYNKAIGFYKAIKELEKEKNTKERLQCNLLNKVVELDLTKLSINNLSDNIMPLYLSNTFTLYSNDVMQNIRKVLSSIQLPCIYKYPIRNKTVQNIYHPFIWNLLYIGRIESQIYQYYNKQIIDYMVNQAYVRYKQSFKIELKQALYALEKAYELNQNDPLIAQCLYSTYYHLRKRASARDLLKVMHKRKHFLNEEEDFLQVMK